MSINKYRPHIFVLPEDDANRQIANGFVLSPNLNSRAIQILPNSGGWCNVLDDFKNIHASGMEQYSHRMFILLIDFDQNEDRLSYVKCQIPAGLTDRVFVLGVLSEPEDLKKNTKKTFEQIGNSLAKGCPDNKNELWGHDLLKHNEIELDRMILLVKPFLFKS